MCPWVAVLFKKRLFATLPLRTPPVHAHALQRTAPVGARPDMTRACGRKAALRQESVLCHVPFRNIRPRRKQTSVEPVEPAATSAWRDSAEPRSPGSCLRCRRARLWPPLPHFHRVPSMSLASLQTYVVEIQVVEIYCEMINDLLADRKKWPAVCSGVAP